MSDGLNLEHTFTEKLGPLPVGGWVLIVGGGLGLALYWKRKHAGTSVAATAAAAAPATAPLNATQAGIGDMAGGPGYYAGGGGYGLSPGQYGGGSTGTGTGGASTSDPSLTPPTTPTGAGGTMPAAPGPVPGIHTTGPNYAAHPGMTEVGGRWMPAGSRYEGGHYLLPNQSLDHGVVHTH